MKKILKLIKRLLIFCSPFILILIVYVITDPFMVIYDYEDYNKRNHIHKNRDFVSTEMFKKNSGKYVYDAFIFGSSTSLFIPPSIWRNYIDTQNNIFSFDASSERLAGIWSKIRYIDKNNHDIKYALFVFDFRTYKEFDNSNPAMMKHYEVFLSSKFNFHYRYFLQFLNIEFLSAIIPYTLFNKYYPYMEGILSQLTEYNDTVTNEYYNPGVEQLIKTDSIKYYEDRKDRFSPRSGIYKEEIKMSTSEHVKMLNDIKAILDKHNTHYRVIICPIYSQIAYNREDLKLTEDVFGKENVFNFTGINKFSQEKSNFYDATHFKKYVGKQLLDSVYFTRAE